jgi:alpha galactosidase C-like protein
MISGDRLTDLDPVRLEILRKVFPSYGQAARPVDLFERDKPEIFALPVKKDFGDWMLVALFNYDEHASATKEVALERLRLDRAKTYVAYDFWREQLLGEVRETLRATLQPASVALLALREERGIPEVVSTSRHFTQGAIELETVAWDASSRVLRGVSLGPPGSAHHVSIYISPSFRWAQQLSGYFYDFNGYTLKLIEPQVLRVLVRGNEAGRVPWEVRFKAI